MTKHVDDATLGQLAKRQHELFTRVKKGTLDPERVQLGLTRLIEDDRDCYEVVKLSNQTSSEVLAETEKYLGYPSMDPRLSTWDFMQGQQGKSYDVMVRFLGYTTNWGYILDYFNKFGFEGHPAPFCAWLQRHHPWGNFFSLPNVSRAWKDPHIGTAFAPRYLHEKDRHRFELVDADIFGHCVVFVGFRESHQTY